MVKDHLKTPGMTATTHASYARGTPTVITQNCVTTRSISAKTNKTDGKQYYDFFLR
jgi:hypothetical protein